MFRKKLEEKRNKLITRAEEIVEKAKAEERALTDDEAKEIEQIKADISQIKATLAAQDSVEELQRDAMQTKKDDTPSDAEGEEDTEDKPDEKAEERAFENYLRGYEVHERAGELTPATTSGGALIPTTIANRIIKKVYDICPILQRSTKYNIKGNLDLPYYDDSEGGITVAYQDEFVALTSSNGKFAKITLTGYLAGALSKVSRSLINNAQFDIVNFVVDEMADAISRFIEKELLAGTSDKVTGLSTLTNSITTAAATAITADEVIKLHDSIKDRYHTNAIWIMSPATRTALRLLKDGNGRYLLNDDISTPFGTSILGKPVYVSENMPDIAAGKAVIYYGDMKGLATKFNEEINIQVLRERYADEHAVGVIGWFEFDSKVEDAQKIAKLVCASA